MTAPTYAFGSPVPTIRHTPTPTPPLEATVSTTTTTPETTVEYGVRDAGGVVRWMDGDGDLPVSGSDYLWGARSRSEEYLLAELKRRYPSAQLVKRTRSVVVSQPEDVPPTLPTAPGSVIRADTVSPVYGSIGRVTLIRTSAETYPWAVAAQSPRAGAGIPSSGIKAAEVLFDAAA